MNTYKKLNQYTTILNITGNVRSGEIYVDTEDVKELKKYSWYVSIASWSYTKNRKKILTNYNYVRAKINGKSEKLHRFVMKVIGKKVIVDHRDRDTFNNKKNNLRIATRSENGINSKLAKNNTSGVAGVRYLKHTQTWLATIKINYKVISKSFSTKVHGSTAKTKAIEARKSLLKTFNDQPKGVLRKSMARETGDSEDMV